MQNTQTPQSSHQSGLLHGPWQRLVPFLRWWPLVNRQSTRDDVIAGLTGAMLGLPQGVAFAILAGLPPQYGLYAAMVPPALSALFGSSLHMVCGPTNAIAILMFASLSPIAIPGTPDYVSLMLTVAFITGVLQLIMGFARLGALVNFISNTVIIGFSAGAAVLIGSTQIKAFFGIPIPANASFTETLRLMVLELPHLNPYVFAVGLFTLLFALWAKKHLRKIPYMISATVAGSLFALGLNAWLGESVTHIQMVGALPSQLPPLSVPDLSLETLRKVAPAALANTILALTLAIGTGRSLALRSGQRIDANQEFVGQGISNVVGSFFSAYPSGGSFNRSGANFEAGAKTPLASVYSSIFLVIIVLLVAPLAAYLPVACVAAILFLVAYGLIDLRNMRKIAATSRSEATVMGVTFACALLLGLQTAIYAGVLLSLMLFLNQAAHPGIRDVKPDPNAEGHPLDADTSLPDCPQVKMLRINGSIFFGAVEHVEHAFRQVDFMRPQQVHLLIASSGINTIDISGAQMLAREAQRRRKLGGGLYFHFLKDAVRHFMEKSGYMKEIGRDQTFSRKGDVMEQLYPRLNSEICRHCHVRIFAQCHASLPNGEPRAQVPHASMAPS